MNFQSINFSLWLDFIHKDFLKKDFEKMINNKTIHGATSNPSIFASSFVQPSYKQDILSLQDSSKKEIYETLAIADIRTAARKLLPMYLQNNDNGFVSIEIDPTLSGDIDGSVKEGIRLFKKIDMPNVMIKVPATTAGYHIVEMLMREGINVNITLVFSPTQALKTISSILKSNSTAKAVISIFVSRFDRMLDAKLPSDLQGLVGIYNASKIYNLIEKAQLTNTRALFASTGVKGDTCPKDYYITQLLYRNSINTAPLATIESYLKNETVEEKDILSDREIDIFFKKLKHYVDINEAYESLLKNGLQAFDDDFKTLLQSL